jgi:hypothetical protein
MSALRGLLQLTVCVVRYGDWYGPVGAGNCSTVDLNVTPVGSSGTVRRRGVASGWDGMAGGELGVGESDGAADCTPGEEDGVVGEADASTVGLSMGVSSTLGADGVEAPPQAPSVTGAAASRTRTRTTNGSHLERVDDPLERHSEDTPSTMRGGW